MRCVVVSKHGNPVITALRKLDLKIRDKPVCKPAYAIVYGGDGAVLHAVRLFPKLPNLCIRRSGICKTCRFNTRVLKKPMLCVYTTALRKLYCHSSLEPCVRFLHEGKFFVEKQLKLEATAFTRRGRKKLLALNEVQLHSSTFFHAARFDVYVGKKLFAENVLGDGIMISTPYGSTAYYEVITCKHFKKGLGVAFNNCIRFKKPLLLSEDSVVKIVARRNCLLLVDNSRETIPLARKELVRIKRARQKAKFVVLTR